MSEDHRSSQERPIRRGTIDDVPPLAMNQKAAIVADAFAREKVKLAAEFGRKGDLQTLQRVVDVPAPSLARIFDTISRAQEPHAAAPGLLATMRSALSAFQLFYSFYGDDEHQSSVPEAVAARKAMADMEAASAKATGSTP